MKRKLPDRGRSVRSIAKVLMGWETSHFEFEGACRHGLRSSLCLEGWPWAKADAEAAEVVAQALQRNGAVRPTWAQGQPEWIDEIVERTRCVWCGGKMPPASDHYRNGVPRKYCSWDCGHAAYSQRARRSGERGSVAEHLARCAARREQTRLERMKPCVQCGQQFSPPRQEQEYCSIECSNAGKMAHLRAKPVPCTGCGTTMHPRNGKRYCSPECYQKHGRPKNQPERQCPMCGTTFKVAKPAVKKVCCSRACADEMRKQRRRQEAA